ncbi:hypothetical protein AGMMS49525_04720 [Bacteroidia bacterium]|nr:hypothetical protein AGMMS49525_04720 [Bacteroidia bacterium]
MTVAERLKKKLNGLVSDIDGLLVDRGLNGSDEYTMEIGQSPAFQLAYADGLYSIIISPNISQGDWSRSWTNKEVIEKIVSNIFNKYAPEENPLPGSISTVTSVSELW